VADNLNSINGIEDSVFATTVKEVALTAYAGIDVEALSVHCSFSFHAFRVF
jgi:hypothetical protein